MDELLSEFLIESQKRLSALDAALNAFPQDPGDAACQKQIFDFLHTIKGASVLLGLQRLEAIAQAGEAVLAKARDKSIDLSADGAVVMLEAIDTVRRIQRTLATSGEEPQGDDSRLIADLKAAAAGQPTSKTVPQAAADPLSASPPRIRSKPRVRVTADALLVPEVAPRGSEPAPSMQPSLSIPLDRVAYITSLVGELVAARNSLHHVLRDRTESDLEEPLQRLDHVTSDLSAAIMLARKQVAVDLPDGFDIVRVLSVQCAGLRYAIPQRSVVELVQLVPGARRVASDEFRVLRLRERKHPWVRLAALLDLEEPPRRPGAREIIVLMDGSQGPFGLAVDYIHDIEEIAVRPLPPVLGNIPVFTGSALMGDGSVALVLDPKTLTAAMEHRRIAAASAHPQLERR